MKKIFFCSLLIALFGLQPVFAQYYDDEETTKAFGFSIGTGFFRASKYMANYYNGSAANVNNIYYVFDNSYRYNEIKQLLNNRDFALYELPYDMRYKISTPISLKFYMNLSPQNTIFIEVGQVSLTATDIFTIEIDSVNHTSEPSLRSCKIWGKESRTMIDLGYRHNFEAERQLRWFYEIGFNVTNTKVIENKIEVGGRDFSIIYEGAYIPGQPNYDPIAQTAIGVGIIGGFGIEFLATKQASLDLGLNMRLQDINLEGYKKFHANFSLYVRLNFLTF